MNNFTSHKMPIYKLDTSNFLTHVLGICFILFVEVSTIAQSNQYQERYRPQFHFSPPEHWINDPCGTVFYNGEYHLMYQYNAGGNTWGPMSWGHAVSKDLVHWENLPVALSPDSQGNIFSGSAIVDSNNTAGFNTPGKTALVAIYTQENGIQQQSLAYSLDSGRVWSKYAGNPVLPNPGISDFRDPGVIWYPLTSEWIMTLAVNDHINIYSSHDLKSWTKKSEFGKNIGSHGSVWECPDFFPINVEGSDMQKWIMMVSTAGPFGGSGTQYFIGDFDGTSYTLDPAFDSILNPHINIPPGQVFEDFEANDYANWQVYGNCFGIHPAKGTLPNQQAVTNYVGNQLVNTFLNGDASQGKLVSEEFVITNKYINFLIGGGNHPKNEEIRLVIGGETVKTATGQNKEKLLWCSWDVTQYSSLIGHFEIIDSVTGGWGHINVDQIMFSDEKAVNTNNEFDGQWIDYGPDFYAGRSWNDIPTTNYKRVWIAWMNNWAYAGNIPTYPWRGAMSLPRAIKLKNLDFGQRVVQEPLDIDTLRQTGVHFENKTINDANAFIKENNVVGTRYEIITSIKCGLTGETGLRLRKKGSNQTLVSISSVDKRVYLDRSKSGSVQFDNGFIRKFYAPLEGSLDTITLHIFVDESSVEVFVNEGERVITAQIYPQSDYDSIEFYSTENSEILSFDSWNLNSIWDKSFSIEEQPDKPQFQIYPNPASDYFFINTDQTTLIDFSLHSLSGISIPMLFRKREIASAFQLLQSCLQEHIYFTSKLEMSYFPNWYLSNNLKRRLRVIIL